MLQAYRRNNAVSCIGLHDCITFSPRRRMLRMQLLNDVIATTVTSSKLGQSIITLQKHVFGCLLHFLWTRISESLFVIDLDTAIHQ